MWFVKYLVKDYKKGILIPKKAKGYLNHIDELDEREREAQRYVDLLNNNMLPPNAKGARRLLPQEAQGNFAETGRVLLEILEKRKSDFLGESGRSQYQNLKSKIHSLRNWPQLTQLKLTIGSFKTEHARSFLNYLVNEKHLSLQTRNKYKSELTTIWKFLIDDSIVSDNPFKNVPWLKPKNTPFRKHPEEVQKVIMENMPKEDMQLYIACMFVFECFIRVTELNRLQLYMIDWDRKILHLTENVCLKSGVRSVPISADLSELMQMEGYKAMPENYFVFSDNGKPGQTKLSYHNFRLCWNNFREHHKISKDYKLYGLKHTGNTKMINKGINTRTLQKLSGYRSLEYIEKHYTSELSVEDIMWVRQH